MERHIPQDSILKEEFRNEQTPRFDAALDRLHETARVVATRYGTSIGEPLKVIEAIREYHKQNAEHNAANKEPITITVRYHTNTRTSSAEEIRQRLLDDYIEKMMAHIHFAYDERTASIIVLQRDADMVPRVSFILTDLGYQVSFNKETSTLGVTW